MSFFIAYLVMILLDMETPFELIFTFSIATCIIIPLFNFMATEDAEKSKDYLKKCYSLLKYPIYISFLMLLLIPSREDIKLIIGAGITYEVITSDVMKELPEKTMRAVDLFLDKMEIDIDNIKPKEVQLPIENKHS